MTSAMTPNFIIIETDVATLEQAFQSLVIETFAPALPGSTSLGGTEVSFVPNHFDFSAESDGQAVFSFPTPAPKNLCLVVALGVPQSKSAGDFTYEAGVLTLAEAVANRVEKGDHVYGFAV